MTDETTPAARPAGPRFPDLRTGIIIGATAVASVVATLGIQHLAEPAPSLDAELQGVARDYVSALNEGRYDDAVGYLTNVTDTSADLPRADQLVKVDPAAIPMPVQSGMRETISDLQGREYRLGDKTESMLFRRVDGRWKLVNAPLLREYRLDGTRSGSSFSQLSGLGRASLITLERRPVPHEGWSINHHGYDSPVTAVVEGPGKNARLEVPATVNLIGDFSSVNVHLSRMDLSTVTEQVEALLTGSMVYRSFYDDHQKGAVEQTFAVRDVTGCSVSGDEDENETPDNAVRLTCQYRTQATDVEHGRARKQNVGEPAAYTRKGVACYHNVAVRMDDGVEGDVDVLLQDGEIKVDWTAKDTYGQPRARALAQIPEEMAQCGAFAGQKDATHSRLVLGLVPVESGADLRTTVSEPVRLPSTNGLSRG